MAAGEVPEADCRATGGAADAAEGAMAATARPAARIVRFIVRCLLGSVDVRKAFAAPAPRVWGSPLDHPGTLRSHGGEACAVSPTGERPSATIARSRYP